MSLLLAPNGHARAGRRCLHPRVKRTCRANPGTSVFDPKSDIPEISGGLLPRQLSAIPAVSHSAPASGRLSGSDLGLRARELGYQFVPFHCFSNPECIILVFKRRALAAESGHGPAMCKHIHSTFPSRSNAKRYAYNIAVLLQTLLCRSP
jgi:hypothetical protein